MDRGTDVQLKNLLIFCLCMCCLSSTVSPLHLVFGPKSLYIHLWKYFLYMYLFLCFFVAQ